MLIYSLGLFVSETAVWSKSAVMSVSSGLRFSTMMAAKNPCPYIVVLAERMVKRSGSADCLNQRMKRRLRAASRLSLVSQM